MSFSKFRHMARRRRAAAVARKPLFFVHVPKTAGTSFRAGVEKVLHPDFIRFDYGPSAPKTSSLIRAVYEGADPLSVIRAMRGGKVAFLAGHVAARKYVGAFGCDRTFTLLRDPIQRVVSEYEHARRVNGFEKSFEHFFRNPIHQNRQAKLLATLDPAMLGLVGVTERFDESIGLFRAVFGLSVPIEEMNTARDDLHVPYPLAEDVLEELRELNQKDLMLYERFDTILSERLEMRKLGKRYVQGAVTELTRSRITGWAWFAPEVGRQNNSPVALEMVQAGKVLRSFEARQLRADLCSLSPPRLGYIGFAFEHGLKAGDSFHLRVAETGQVLQPECLVVPEK